MSEKTEDATPKKRREARKEGQVPRSPEFTGMAVMLSAIAVLVATGMAIAEQMVGLCLQAIEVATRPGLEPSAIGPFLTESMWAVASMMGPLIGVTFVFAAFITYLQVGPVLTFKPVIPDGSKLNMANGFKELCSPKKLVDLAKNTGKLGAMAAVGYLVLRQLMPAMAMTPRGSLLDATVALAKACLQLSLFLVLGLVVFGIIDLIWQRYQHEKKLRMSKHEVKREHKESEGDPMMEGKRKERHREILQGSGADNVEDADAVVVNPSHVAVALRYRKSEMNAPTIVACGKGVTARKIKKRARRHAIPIVRNVDLARALVEVGLESQIPEEFFEPVAEILQYVYDLAEDDGP